MKNKFYPLFIIVSIVLVSVFYLSALYSYFFQKVQRREHAELNGSRVVFDINTQALLDKHRDDHPIVAQIYPDAKIAIMVTGLGLSKHLVDKALTLPVGVTLGFSPYAENIETQLASDKMEHEICLNIPVESSKYPEDDQDLALTNKLPMFTNRAKLVKIFSSIKQKLKCVYTSEDDQYTKNPDAAKMLIDTVKANNMVLIYGAKGTENYLNQDVNNHGTIFQVDSHIDSVLSQNKIINQLNLLVDKAHAQGYAVGVASAYPITMETINNWSKTLPDLNVRLVSISDIHSR